MKHTFGRLTACVMALAFAVAPQLAFAAGGNAHFNYANASVSGNTLTVDFKEAGLGTDISQVSITLSATAECINPGSNHPKAANKESVSSSGIFSVKNGTTGDQTLSVTATFQPDCSPPMTVTYTNVTLCDTTNNVCAKVSGP